LAIYITAPVLWFTPIEGSPAFVPNPSGGVNTSYRGVPGDVGCAALPALVDLSALVCFGVGAAARPLSASHNASASNHTKLVTRIRKGNALPRSPVVLLTA
jgi:hypothetical protein